MNDFMVCRFCKGRVEWVGPMSSLGQHGTKCTSCGARNSQITPEDYDWEDYDDAEE